MVILIKKSVPEYAKNKGTYSITFGNRGENHKGMQIIDNGIKISREGFSCQELREFKEKLDKNDYETELIDLTLLFNGDVEDVEEASILIIRNFLQTYYKDEYSNDSNDSKDVIDHADFIIEALYEEIEEQECDSKAKMYGRVVNKHARHNLVYADFSQTANYEQGMGTVINFEEMHYLNDIRKSLYLLFGEKAKNLIAEENYYYNEECGIGWHGDSEREIVICLRLGHSMKICYNWFQQGNPIGKKLTKMLHHGDLYIMSKKAVGTDWKKKIIPTLRHSAGSSKYTTLPSSK
jgi:alkylated DNA repair dioxygenase AlkB